MNSTQRVKRTAIREMFLIKKLRKDNKKKSFEKHIKLVPDKLVNRQMRIKKIMEIKNKLIIGSGIHPIFLSLTAVIVDLELNNNHEKID